MLKYAYLFTSYLLLFTNTLFSQCNIPFEPNIVFDEDIPIMCEGFDGFCSELPWQYTELPLWGCPEAEFAIQNAQLIRFIAGSTDLIFTITPFDCNIVGNGSGIQAVLYEEYHPYYEEPIPIVYECGEGNVVPLHFDLFDLNVGKQYYLLIDGWVGNVCGYEIDVEFGETAANTNLEPPVLIEPEGICLNTEVTFSAESTDACYFIWSVTGGIIEYEYGSNIDVIVTDLDLFEVCVESTNFCAVSDMVCSSVMEIVYMEVDSLVTDTFCTGDSYFISGMFFQESGNYEFLDTVDCEIINFEIELSTIEPSDSTIMESICAGSCFVFLGQDYCEEGEYQIELQAVNGCDSIIFLNLEITEAPESLTEDQICNGQTYEWNGNTYDMPGVYEEIIVTADGCDSLAILELTLKENIQVFNVSICSNEEYTFDGETYNTDVMVENIYTGADGCDSIRVLNLTVQLVWSGSETFTICEGDTLFYGDSELTEAGNYQIIVETPGVCDSVTFLSLEVLGWTESIDFTICEGDTLFYSNSELTEEGTYTIIVETPGACDSVTYLSLEVLDTILLEQDTTILIGEEYNGIPILGDTVFVEVFESSYGCDSTVVTNVFIITNTKNLVDHSIDVFPNPFIDHLNIRIKGNPGQYIKLEVLNIHGQLVFEMNKTEMDKQESIDLSHLAPGSYFLILQNEESYFRKKMIKI